MSAVASHPPAPVLPTLAIGLGVGKPVAIVPPYIGMVLRGKTLGVWFGGNEYPFLNWMNKLGYKTDGSAGGVKVLKQGFNVDPLLQQQAACVSTMTYNEYWQVIDAGVKPEDLVTFKYEDEGVATLEDQFPSRPGV